MPKTPLLSSLRSLWVDLLRARSTGVPLDELRQRRLEGPRRSRRQLLAGGAALAGIAELGRGHNSKLSLQFERRGWQGDGPWPGVSNGSSYADTGYQASWEVTRAQPGRAGILALYAGGSVADAAHLDRGFATADSRDVRRDARRGLRELAPVYPGLDFNGRAIESVPHRSPLFRASYSFYEVGQYTTFAGYEKARQGGVLFCGEHTSTDFQGFMEGGASEGARAGEELLELLGVSASTRPRPASRRQRFA